MREITVEFLAKEAARLRAVLLQKPLFHPSGIRLHSSGESITPELARRMKEAGMKQLYLLEPGEAEFRAAGSFDVDRVEPRGLLEGDILAEDLTGLDGTVLIPAGQVLDAVLLARAKGTGAPTVAIRRRGLEEARRQAQAYLAALPPAAVRPQVSREPLTEVFRTSLIQVRPLLVPVARVAVGFRDDFLRALAVNTLKAAGHEPTVWEPSPADVGGLKAWRPDLLMIDLETAPALCGVLRKTDLLWTMAILVCAEEGRRREVHRALEEGANDVLSRPPTPEMILHKVRVAMQAMGRAVNLRPGVLMERRKVPRRPTQVACEIRDFFLSKPLPVPAGTVVDLTESGARVEYDQPGWPCLYAYSPHGVHPRHFFYAYARSNPLGRDLVLRLPVPGGPPRDRYARVVHILSRGVSESAGFVFQRGTAPGREGGMTGVWR